MTKVVMISRVCRFIKDCLQRPRLGDVAAFENRQPVTEAKFIIKSSLFVLLLGVIRRLGLTLISEQKVENIFVAPPYCQTACCLLAFCVHRICYQPDVYLCVAGSIIFPVLSIAPHKLLLLNLALPFSKGSAYSNLKSTTNFPVVSM